MAFAFAATTMLSAPLAPLVPLFVATGLMFAFGTLDDGHAQGR